ncbi:DNA polymerase III subunit beta [Caldisericum exile]|uniref:Beta sliding clamp n=1 Tax=Caldisericum exile (strain DSM 21853 / NBRC 104410 / AZM16c01) TaxID=511051 RepID=A0A7U6GD13_CALEA|nr:DNA polymerase III subunit beta [Caldisericum exile]BAL80129.1 DNA polymerase III subunit beta [Caldisericum exile AZM16c01]
MRIKAKTSELTKAVNNVGKVISGKSVDLILENILLKVNDKLTLTTTNLEQAMEYALEVEILENGLETSTILPYDILRDITPKFKGEYIELEIKEKKAVIKEDSGEFTLHTFNPEAFAIIPEVSSELKFSLSFGTLKELIENTIFAASKKEESRREFKGVYFDIKDDYVNLVATDSTALALNKIKEAGLPKTSFIVPWKALDILTHLSYEDNTPVQIEVTESNIKFSLPNLSLISLLINGQFPQYESVIPGEAEFYGKVAKNVLMDALDIIEVFAKKGTGRIIFTFSHGNLIIESSSSEIGQGKKVIPCETNAEVSLQFYAEKIIDGIEHVKDQTVFFGIQGPIHPVLVKGTDSEDYLYVIMPQKPIE